MNLEDYIATIPDYPKTGILFRDVTPILKDGAAYKNTILRLSEIATELKADVIAGPESRGFIFGCPVATELSIPFSPVRKPGKLPRETISCEYELEYGSNTLHMHKDSILPGQRVLIVDDLLATGGTAKATAKMVEELGAVVAGFAFVIELEGLPGREVLKGYDVRALLVMSDK